MQNELVIEPGKYRLRNGEIIEILHKTAKGGWAGLDSLGLRRFWNKDDKHSYFYAEDIMEKICQS